MVVRLRWAPVLLLVMGCGAPPGVAPISSMTSKPPPPPPASRPPAPTTARVPFVLIPGQRAKLRNGPTLSIEEVVAAPGATRATFVLVVEIAGYQKPIRMPMDLQDRRSGWTPDDFRITADSADELAGTPRLAFHAERVTSEEVGEPPIITRVERGGRIALSKELSMTFVGHGHKRVDEGESSPLMVTVSFQGPDVPAEDSHYNAGGESSPPQFSWRNYRFTVTKHGYDAFMELRIERLAFEQISLEP